MKKHFVFVLVFALVASSISVNGQDDDLSFTVETIQLDDALTYDLAISANSNIAAVYAGRTATLFLGIPIIGEYTVETELLPIRLVDLNTGDVLHELTGATDYIVDAAFTSDGSTLASVHRNGIITLWDVETGEPIRDLITPFGIQRVQFLPGEPSLVLQSDSLIHQFLVMDIETGFITAIWRPQLDSYGEIDFDDPFARYDYSYPAFDILPGDVPQLVTASANGEIMLWDTGTLNRQVLLAKDEEHQANFNIRKLQHSNGGETLVYYDHLTEQFHILDMNTQDETAVYTPGSAAFAVSPDGKQIAWTDNDGVWIRNLEQPDDIMLLHEGDLPARAGLPLMTFSEDGQRLIVGAPAAPDGDEIHTIIVVNFE